MKLSLLKWVYNLGYNKAEDRYYHALKEAIHTLSRTSELKDYMTKNSKDFEEKQTRQAELIWKLEGIVNSVFHPIINIPVEPKDRFEP